MPIVITREGKIVSTPPPLTQEQKDAAWEKIVRAWAQKHTDVLKALMEETP